MIKYSKEIMERWGDIILKRKREWNFIQSVWYQLDWKTSEVRNLRDWFSEHLREMEKVPEFMQHVKLLSKIKKNDDRVVEALRVIKNHVTYIPDQKVWGVKEKWQTPQLTWYKRTGDCEDGSLLLAALLHYCKIPPDQWEVRCGNVITGEGHCYIVYVSNETGLEYALDWCYWYDDSYVARRKFLMSDKRYGRPWFSFNNKESWKHLKDPSRMFMEE